ncbi:MAG: transcriptional repressor [Thermoguttaceae bacterium]|nr:transcriptional repressor [Thermoguttaceae bacterium]
MLSRFDANPKRHDHFYCSKSGRVFDFEIENLETLLPESELKI